MLDVFALSIAGNLRLVALSLRHLGSAGATALPRRILVLALGLPLFLLLQGLHWLGFALDALLFRGERRIQVIQPVFIVGIPRSGTTYLHRMLAEDARFTSLTTWEAVLAPSVSERHLWRTMGRVLRPLAGLGRRWRPAALARFDAIHPLGLRQPEEDFLLLLPVSACLLLALLFPRDDRFWDLAFFDDAVSPWRRRAVMRWYRRCVQKHLYVHGTDKRFLAKNPSFSPMVHSLEAAFPDAVFIVCGREPAGAVASQLSSLDPLAAWWGEPPTQPVLRERLLAMLAYYYAHILDHGTGARRVYVTHEQIRIELLAVCQRVYGALALPLEGPRLARLADESRRNCGYCSAHRHELSRFGLNPQLVAQRFGGHWNAFVRAAGGIG